MIMSTVVHLYTKDGHLIDSDKIARFLEGYSLTTTVVFGRSAAYINIAHSEREPFPHEEPLKLMRALRKVFPSLLIDGFASAGIVNL
jgi:hypothetical protein